MSYLASNVFPNTSLIIPTRPKTKPGLLSLARGTPRCVEYLRKAVMRTGGGIADYAALKVTDSAEDALP